VHSIIVSMQLDPPHMPISVRMSTFEPLDMYRFTINYSCLATCLLPRVYFTYKNLFTNKK